MPLVHLMFFQCVIHHVIIRFRGHSGIRSKQDADHFGLFLGDRFRSEDNNTYIMSVTFEQFVSMMEKNKKKSSDPEPSKKKTKSKTDEPKLPVVVKRTPEQRAVLDDKNVDRVGKAVNRTFRDSTVGKDKEVALMVAKAMREKMELKIAMEHSICEAKIAERKPRKMLVNTLVNE
jgi:hypothetical protein